VVFAGAKGHRRALNIWRSVAELYPEQKERAFLAGCFSARLLDGHRQRRAAYTEWSRVLAAYPQFAGWLHYRTAAERRQYLAALLP
jgi:hypothetical protein